MKTFSHFTLLASLTLLISVHAKAAVMDKSSKAILLVECMTPGKGKDAREKIFNCTSYQLRTIANLELLAKARDEKSLDALSVNNRFYKLTDLNHIDISRDDKKADKLKPENKKPGPFGITLPSAEKVMNAAETAGRKAGSWVKTSEYDLSDVIVINSNTLAKMKKLLKVENVDMVYERIPGSIEGMMRVKHERFGELVDYLNRN